MRFGFAESVEALFLEQRVQKAVFVIFQGFQRNARRGDERDGAVVFQDFIEPIHLLPGEIIEQFAEIINEQCQRFRVGVQGVVQQVETGDFVLLFPCPRGGVGMIGRAHPLIEADNGLIFLLPFLRDDFPKRVQAANAVIGFFFQHDWHAGRPQFGVIFKLVIQAQQQRGFARAARALKQNMPPRARFDGGSHALIQFAENVMPRRKAVEQLLFALFMGIIQVCCHREKCCDNIILRLFFI